MALIKTAVEQKIKDHGLTVKEVEAVLSHPEQVVPGDKGRLIYQSRDGRHLIRVVVEGDRTPLEVVTAYRTRDVQKYWRGDDAD